MRGKAKGDELGLSQTRITPACAGKRAAHSFQAVPPWDHPRMCGEKRNLSMLHFRRKGSPPHVRGKAAFGRECYYPYGITPACAGKRQALAKALSRSRDHPRMCGEKVSSTSPIKCLKGSPPRMRGKVVKEVTGQTATRITPAYAGKSSSRGVRTCFEKDHPRVCGEKRSQSTSASRRAGSPPRMRGKGILRCEIHY